MDIILILKTDLVCDNRGKLMKEDILDVYREFGVRSVAVYCSVCSKNCENPDTIIVQMDQIAHCEYIEHKNCFTFKEKVKFPCGHELDKAYGELIYDKNPYDSNIVVNGTLGYFKP